VALESILQYIIDLIQSAGAFGVFAGVLIESIIAPLPSPLIIMAAGAILISPSSSLLSILLSIVGLIAIPAAIASSIGSSLGFEIGFKGGKFLIDKYSWLLGVEYDSIVSLNKKIEKFNPMATIIILRAIPFMPLSLVSVAFGVLRVKRKTFYLATLIGTFFRAIILGYLGFVGQELYTSLANPLSELENIASIAIVAALAISLLAIKET